MTAHEHWLDTAARLAAPPAGLTRGEVLRRVAAGALAVSIGFRPQFAPAATGRCGFSSRAACYAGAERKFDKWLDVCNGFYTRYITPWSIAAHFECDLDGHSARAKDYARCDAFCLPPRKPPRTPPGKSNPKPPPPAPKPPSYTCADCPKNSYCSPCKSNSSGIICCALPPRGGKSPCCS
jgi:hypothetical protein